MRVGSADRRTRGLSRCVTCHPSVAGEAVEHPLDREWEPDRQGDPAMSDQLNTSDLEVSAAAVSDGAYTLLVADFSDTGNAWEAYEGLKSVEDGRTVEIEGVVVVSRSADGNLEIQR